MATRPPLTVGAEAVDLTAGLEDGESYEVQITAGSSDLLYLWDGAAAPDPLDYRTKRASARSRGGIFRIDVDAAEPTWAWAPPGKTVVVSISDA